MTIYETLKNDHQKIRVLLDKLVEASEGKEIEPVKKIVERLCDVLIPHSRAEEAVFYNSLREIEMAKELVTESYDEHMEAEALLRSFQAATAFDIKWTNAAKRLREIVLHHFDFEEQNVFSAAQQLFTFEESEMMADTFEKMKPEIQDGSMVSNTVDMIVNMMPPRFAEPFRNFVNRHP